MRVSFKKKTEKKEMNDLIFTRTVSNKCLKDKYMLMAHGDKRHWLHRRVAESVLAGESCRKALREIKKSIVDFEFEKEVSRKIATPCPFGFPPMVGSIRCWSDCSDFIGWRVKPLPHNLSNGSIYCRKQMNR